MARIARIGSVSSGTLLPRDLMVAFSSELESLDGAGRYKALITDSRSVDPDCEDARELVGDLEEALNEFAPPYSYFGAHHGDGADFGYWPDWDAINADRRSGELPSADELPMRSTASGYFLHISDHGNTELYQWHRREQRWQSIWGVV